MTTATTARGARRVEHVMGMPISLALRGRHTDDGHAAAAAWAGVLDSLRQTERVFSTYQHDSVVSRIRRGELAVADAPGEVHEVLAIGARAERASEGAFRCGARSSTPVARPRSPRSPSSRPRALAPSLTDADVDATAAYALGPRAAEWLGRRVGRTGLVVWNDGTTTTLTPPRP